jgi:predicted nucleic acid-binding protein
MAARPLVLDASIVVKLALEEEYSAASADLFTLTRPLWAPDLMPIEVGNILWKATQRARCSAQVAEEAYARILQAPIRIVPAAAYLERSLQLALAYGRTIYDFLYLALAEHEAGLFVTADERLVNALRGTPMALSLHWIGAGAPPP